MNQKTKTFLLSIPILGLLGQRLYHWWMHAALARKIRGKYRAPIERHAIAFAFNTMDRVDFTVKTTQGLDAANLDIIWCDGSRTQEGKNTPGASHFKRARLKEIHFDVTGGPDVAIQYSLNRMLELGYPFVGLLENDIQLEEGWVETMNQTIDAAKKDGLDVGAVTVRTIQSRTLFHRPDYAMVWLMGAGMAMFTREGAQAVLDDYKIAYAREVNDYWKQFGSEITEWELWMDRPERRLGADWWYGAAMMKRGLASVGSIPNMARNIDVDVEKESHTEYVMRSRAFESGHDVKYKRFMLEYSNLKRRLR